MFCQVMILDMLVHARVAPNAHCSSKTLSLCSNSNYDGAHTIELVLPAMTCNAVMHKPNTSCNKHGDLCTGGSSADTMGGG